MTWQRQEAIRSNPEKIVGRIEMEGTGSWKERYEGVTIGQVRKKLEYSPELREQLKNINPDDMDAIKSIANKIGEDEAILAAIAFAIRSKLIGTN